MAAVIAHEVKNPLAAVRGAIQVIGSRLPPGAGDAEIVKAIVARLDGLNELMQDLLVFARPPAPKRRWCGLPELVDAVAALLKADPANAALEVSVSGAVPPVHVDPVLLTIVFQNLMTNAAQAMQGHGTIAVTFGTSEGWHCVTLSDAGPGIPAEIRAALFRPFKTTKARGTGLGMATAKQLVESHGGHISVESPDGGGTTVVIRLPSSEDTADA